MIKFMDAKFLIIDSLVPFEKSFIVTSESLMHALRRKTEGKSAESMTHLQCCLKLHTASSKLLISWPT